MACAAYLGRGRTPSRKDKAGRVRPSHPSRRRSDVLHANQLPALDDDEQRLPVLQLPSSRLHLADVCLQALHVRVGDLERSARRKLLKAVAPPPSSERLRMSKRGEVDEGPTPGGAAAGSHRVVQKVPSSIQRPLLQEHLLRAPGGDSADHQRCTPRAVSFALVAALLRELFLKACRLLENLAARRNHGVRVRGHLLLERRQA
mmetsp:Transcript_129270/g.361784  ORF Transcript_129270/g.361784 Transcript_129270/m.361784 type:complete len:203 (-) Transcript_129270:292-900(-)